MTRICVYVCVTCDILVLFIGLDICHKQSALLLTFVHLPLFELFVCSS